MIQATFAFFSPFPFRPRNQEYDFLIKLPAE